MNIVGVVALVGWWRMPLAIVFVSTGYQIPEFVPPRFMECNGGRLYQVLDTKSCASWIHGTQRKAYPGVRLAILV